jgi:putative mRNA 3-end processing factor
MLSVGPGGPLGLEETKDGLVLRALGLALDPVRPAARAFVSHVHAALPNAESIASRETLGLMEALSLAEASSSVVLEWGESLELPVDRAYGGGTARLTLAHAGHVLGGAQLLIDHPRGRLVYTGDWSGERAAGHAAGDVAPCDELVVNSTFALPIFRFPPFAQTMAALVDWCAARLADGARPIVLAQTPGPAQSIARALAARGLAVEAEERVLRTCLAYEALGCPIGPVRPASDPPTDAVFVAPPGARSTAPPGARSTAPPGARLTAPSGARSTAPRGTPRRSSAVAYASGWALLDAAVDQKRADAAFVLADLADFDSLVAMVEATGAKRVHAVRGDAGVFARSLRARGIDAGAIELPAIDDRASA